MKKDSGKKVMSQSASGYPRVRMRRMRKDAWSRALMRETELKPHHLIWPLFVQEGKNKRTPVNSLPGVDRLSIDLVVKAAKDAERAGIVAIALFPVVDAAKKDEDGSEALNRKNLVCRAISEVKKNVPGIGIIADVALDPYTSHGHDGVVRKGDVANDETVAILCKQAVTLAQAGADVVAPSDMMDGRIGAIRDALDAEGFEQVRILSYAAKYASHYYGAFREAVGSKSALGKSGKHSYQMDFANVKEALREVELDIREGADMVMVKPAMLYLDVVAKVSGISPVPVFAYQVGTEYAMILLAAERGLLPRADAMHEALLACRRAGATGIFTYAALEMARFLKNKA